ncbi:uncharacterized protein LOC127003976 [Eriocheir sinensis]|uniref:uncharacterized protein LOC127003976 n=1 Tax=Eriocheir sinensis TaxID=95602 RepID=UPI0021CAB556|nr:uncharacterized protein LOC127003976 [Eriocheir sinensis]XP_050727010.1 uncharacterized protein LOC127003976 [Eriocheir sinensis]XP_050727012.1 uncharacterized protein LOC127003976 [Eriocheir sinensis]XP_050727013.1 uncharacterized protein LOC127003976 [Eriocheir sinensis]
MAAEQDSESQLPDVERSQAEADERPRQGYIERDTTDRWKKASFVLAAAAILLLIGLATSLGVFLAKTECEPPSTLNNATTTFLGSAVPGTEVDYFCHAPLFFPGGSPSFTVTCNNDLQWSPEVPLCGIYSSRQCTFPDQNLTLASSPANPAGLEVKLTLDGSSPPQTVQLDIPRYENDLCAYGGTLQNTATFLSGRQRSPALLAATTLDNETAVVVVVVFESVDPTQLFEVRVRSVGFSLAVTVLQEAIIETIITSYPANSTTTAAMSTSAV